MTRLALVLAITRSLLVVLPTQLIAQVHGRVVAPNGTPLIGAVVTLWTQSTERDHATTDARGGFVFSPTQLAAINGISVRAIGYRPLTLRWTAADSVLGLTLEPFAAPLPELVATGLKVQCPSADEAEARRLWTTLRMKYDLVPRALGLTLRLSWIRETAYETEVGSIDEARVSHSPGSAGLYGLTREAGYRFVVDSGYARTLRDSRGQLRADGDGTYFEWWYPSFHRWQPDHFIEPSFGQLQNLALGPKVGGLPALLFCSRDHKRPYVAGALILSSDTTVAESAWQFYTDKRRENAGGHAWYLPPTRGATQRYLLPSTSVFWRRRGGQRGLYFHESAINQQWIFGPDAEIPRLPVARTPPGA